MSEKRLTELPKLSPLVIIAVLAFFVFYQVVLVLIGVTFSGAIAVFLGLAVLSKPGLMFISVGTGLLIALEWNYFLKMDFEQAPPILWLLLTVGTLPWTVSQGISTLNEEYYKLRELLASFPHSIIPMIR